MKFFLTNLFSFLFFSIGLFSQENDTNEAYHQKLETWKKQKETIEKQNQEILNSKTAKEKFNAGNAAYRQGNYSAAVTAFQEAVKIDPNYQKAYTNLGLACKQMGDYQNALRYYDMAITMRGGEKAISARTMGYALAALVEIKDFDKAITAGNLYLIENPADANIFYYLVYCYNAAGYPQDALAKGRRGLKFCDNEETKAALNFELGEAYAKIGKVSEAIECYRYSMQNTKWKETAEYQIRRLDPAN